MKFLKQKEINGHSAAVYACAVQGGYIYSGSADKYVARWKIDEGIQDKFAIRFEQSIYALEFFGDRYLVVGLADGGLHIFDLQERKEIKYFTQHTVGIFCIAYNPVSGQLYVTDADGNLSVWSKTFELEIYLPLDAGKIRSMSISANGKHFALACQDECFRIFDAANFNEIHTVKAHENGVTSILFNPMNEAELFTGGKDALLKRWNWKTETQLQSVVAHTFAIYSIISLDGGNVLATASRDKNVKTWKTEDLTIIERLDHKAGGHHHSVNDLAKINEHTFVSCSDDKKLIVWGE